jgi:hypothetical protein
MFIKECRNNITKYSVPGSIFTKEKLVHNSFVKVRQAVQVHRIFKALPFEKILEKGGTLLGHHFIKSNFSGYKRALFPCFEDSLSLHLFTPNYFE